jgi:hypothetical protein
MRGIRRVHERILCFLQKDLGGPKRGYKQTSYIIHTGMQPARLSSTTRVEQPDVTTYLICVSICINTCQVKEKDLSM